ncbi:hypothetical protein ACWEKR_34600 [Nocardia sp. NPDC004573]
MSAEIDGGSLFPGVVADAHHSSNPSGYAVDIRYRTPSDVGEAGLTMDFSTSGALQITMYRAGLDLGQTHTFTMDTTAADQARRTIEDWIREHPGSTETLEMAARTAVSLMYDHPPQTVDVLGITVRWAGELR